jgi:hypothetical protein
LDAFCLYFFSARPLNFTSSGSVKGLERAERYLVMINMATERKLAKNRKEPENATRSKFKQGFQRNQILYELEDQFLGHH